MSSIPIINNNICYEEIYPDNSDFESTPILVNNNIHYPEIYPDHSDFESTHIVVNKNIYYENNHELKMNYSNFINDFPLKNNIHFINDNKNIIKVNSKLKNNKNFDIITFINDETKNNENIDYESLSNDDDYVIINLNNIHEEILCNNYNGIINDNYIYSTIKNFMKKIDLK